jgi:hypothetical protein
MPLKLTASNGQLAVLVADNDGATYHTGIEDAVPVRRYPDLAFELAAHESEAVRLEVPRPLEETGAEPATGEIEERRLAITDMHLTHALQIARGEADGHGKRRRHKPKPIENGTLEARLAEDSDQDAWVGDYRGLSVRAGSDENRIGSRVKRRLNCRNIARDG